MEPTAAGPLARRVVGAVAVRPWLWPTAVGQLFRLAAPGWWRRRPFLPTPDPDYLAFRLQTMYGGSGAPEVAEAADLVAYLEWCRSYRRLLR